MWDPYTEFEHATLPNGLNVYSLYWPNRPWIALNFLIHSGAEQDPIGLEGLAHFVEHVVSENTSIPHKDLRDFFSQQGGGANFGATSYPNTLYKFFLPAKRVLVKKALDLFGQMLITAKLKKFIERERQVILAEFERAYPAQFRYDLDLKAHQVLYKGFWLERFTRPLGHTEAIKAITENDLQSFYDTYYAPQNMSIICVGGMKLDEIVDFLSKSPFGIIKEGKVTKESTPVSSFSTLSENKHTIKISDYLSVPVSCGAYRSLARIPGTTNIHTVRLVRKMLNSIVNEEVREKNAWSYHIGCSSCNFRYFFELSIECGSLLVQALDNIEEVIEASIASIQDCEDLFEKIKHNDCTESLMLDLKGQEIADGLTNDLVLFQKVISMKEWISETKKITIDDVCQMIKWLKPENRWTLMAIP